MNSSQFYSELLREYKRINHKNNVDAYEEVVFIKRVLHELFLFQGKNALEAFEEMIFKTMGNFAIGISGRLQVNINMGIEYELLRLHKFLKKCELKNYFENAQEAMPMLQNLNSVV